ncbi:MAG: ATP-binding cassette domain-containing protein, partial [Actinobacteria bacterium]|nr:ATP-binding cassette domain-containing protein [Actinomycetota bacterium]
MRVSATPLIELRSACFGYDHTSVLSDVNLTVRQGDVLAVLGSNGSGKSTLIRGMLGIADLLSGEVALFGQPRAQFRERWRIGFVPQRNQLAGSLPVTVREVVESGRIVRHPIWKRFGAADRAAVANALATVGLADLASRPLQSLSGGQQRRVAIARALA